MLIQFYMGHTKRETFTHETLSTNREIDTHTKKKNYISIYLRRVFCHNQGGVWGWSVSLSSSESPRIPSWIAKDHKTSLYKIYACYLACGSSLYEPLRRRLKITLRSNLIHIYIYNPPIEYQIVVKYYSTNAY